MAGESWVSNISISDRHSSDDLTNKIGIYLEIEFKFKLIGLVTVGNLFT